MLDLVKILKDCPNGTKLYCPIFGEVIFVKVLNDGSDYKIKTTTSRTKIEVTFTADGRYYESEPDAECVLFPSKDCRDWSKFKCPQKTEFEKGDHVLWNDIDGNEFVGVFDKYTKSGQYLARTLREVNGAYYGGNPKDLTKIMKFNQKWLRTGDEVLVRDNCDDNWCYTLFSHISDVSEDQPFSASGVLWKYCIPYNCETHHLVGTRKAEPEFYKYR